MIQTPLWHSPKISTKQKATYRRSLVDHITTVLFELLLHLCKGTTAFAMSLIGYLKKTHPSALNGSYHTRNHSHYCRIKNVKIMSPVFHVRVRQCSLDFPMVNFNTACHLLPPHVYWCSWEEFLWRLTAVQPVIAGQGTFTRVHKGSSVNIFRSA